MISRASIASLGLFLMVPAVVAQEVPLVTLGKELVEFPEPFTNIVGVRELQDGRVVVADPRERVLQVLDFSAGSARLIGREGQGPGEWRLPTALFALPGDSTVVFDVANFRYLVLTPEPAPAYTFSMVGGAPGAGGPGAPVGARPAGAGQQGGRPAGAPQGAGRADIAAARTQAVEVGGGLRAPEGVDRRGLLYSTTPPIRMGQNGPEATDSVSILRMNRDGSRTDTIGSIHRPGAQVSGTAGGAQLRMVIGAGTPFDPRDEWAVAPDGRIAVVRHSPYRVEWIAPAGTVTRGPVQPYTPIRITDADKEEAAEARQRSSGMRVMTGPGGTQVSIGGGAGGAPEPVAEEWPDTKPPFTAGAARVAPNGHLWVLRTRASNDRVPRYDVFDGAGRLVRRVALPRETRLAGFGESSVYVIRRDADDLEYLQRLDGGGLFGGR